MITIDMTKQEIRQTLLRAISEGRLQIQNPDLASANPDPGGRCYYRSTGRDGKTYCCGIGALIPDAEYDPAMEMVPLWQLLQTDASDPTGKPRVAVPNDIRALLLNLQLEHDDLVSYLTGFGHFDMRKRITTQQAVDKFVAYIDRIIPPSAATK